LVHDMVLESLRPSGPLKISAQGRWICALSTS